MKKLIFFWTLLSLLCFSLFSTSCKKDEEEEEYIVTNHEDSDTYDDSNIREDSGSETTKDKDDWSFIVMISNKEGSKPIYVYFDGKQEFMIGASKELQTRKNVNFNQNRVLVEIKTASGVVLDSHIVTKGDSYNGAFMDPFFTVNTIVLKKWYTGNLFDKPDPWFRISSGDEVVGRTDYLSDRTDGSQCIFSDLYIIIKDVYSRVDFSLYDYNLGYSTVGSSFISGLYTDSFINHLGETTFDMETDELSFTVEGTWFWKATNH